MSPQTIGFWFLALVSVVSALMVVMNRNPVRCALFLIVNFSCLAIFYLMLHAEVLAALQILVYAGAIMVLFLFVISAMLFTIGVVGVLIRKNPIVIFMCIELMLNAVNLVFIAFSRIYGQSDGQIFAFFVMTVAAAEVAVGLGIIVAIFRQRHSIDVDEVSEMKG